MYFRNPIPSPPARARVLDAAERLVLETGAGHLTLDAVAKYAGVSKGGLLYHFPTKDSLLEAMLARFLSDVEEQIAARCARAKGTPTRLDEFRERVRVLLEPHTPRRRAGAAILAASADKPALMAHCRKSYREFVDEIATLPGGFERAALVQLAVDGLVLGELLQLSPYTAEERSQLVKALLKAADRCGRMQ
jgi:AcrR family transcriptional regulator